MGLNRIRGKYLFLLIAFAMPFSSAKADLLVTDQTKHSVLRFSNAGVPLGTFIDKFVPAGSGGLQGTGAYIFGPDGNLYVSDFIAHVVRRYNGMTGASMGVFTSGYSFAAPGGLAFGPDGNFYVADVSIVKFDGTTGAF